MRQKIRTWSRFLIVFSKWALWWAFFFTHSMDGWHTPAMGENRCLRQLHRWMVNWCLRPLRKWMVNQILEPLRRCMSNRVLKQLRWWKLDRVLERVVVDTACGNVGDCCSRGAVLCPLWSNSDKKCACVLVITNRIHITVGATRLWHAWVKLLTLCRK